MNKLQVVISNNAPKVRNSLWLKPVSGGFVLYALYSGKWNPCKMVDDNGTSSIADDVIQNLVGSVQDEASANTINGTKAYADNAAQTVGGTIVGNADDDITESMTLHGLKNYIDAQIEALG